MDCWKWVRCETNYGGVRLDGKEVASALVGLSGFGFGFVFETVFNELERTVVRLGSNWKRCLCLLFFADTQNGMHQNSVLVGFVFFIF